MTAAAQQTEGQLAGQAWTKDLLQATEIWPCHSDNLVTMASFSSSHSCLSRQLHACLSIEHRLLKLLKNIILDNLATLKKKIAFIINDTTQKYISEWNGK